MTHEEFRLASVCRDLTKRIRTLEESLARIPALDLEVAELRVVVWRLREQVRSFNHAEREPGDGYCDCGRRLDEEHSHGHE